MQPDSKVLANRVDLMVAFQAGEPIQYRSKRRAQEDWYDDKGAGLVFNFTRYEYRRKPVAREGYIFASVLHQHPTDFHRKTDRDTCFKVREVLEGE